MNKIITKLLAVTLFTLPSAGAVRSNDAVAPTADEKECSELIYNDLNAVTRCVWSENRIKLILIPGPEGTKKIPPLLYLLGGPGGRAEIHIPHMGLLANTFGRAVLLPDTADSFPSLDCRRTDLDDAQWGVARAPGDATFYTRPLQEARLEACLAQVFVGEAVKTAVSTEAQAARLKELREALGISKWAVMAESYGARVALSLSEKDRHAIEKLILDSPETPWVLKFWHTGKNFHEALTRLSELCRDEYLCPALRIHMESKLPEQIALFQRDGVEPLALRDLYSREVVAYARPTQEQLLITTFMAMRSPDRMELLPYIAASNNDETLKKRFGLLLSQLLRPGGSLNVGFHHAVRCSELPLEAWYAALEADSASYPALSPFVDYLEWRQRYVCDALGLSAPDVLPVPAMPHEVPTLVLSGGLDPVTPYDVVAAAFPGMRHQTYEPLGHIVHSQRNCVLQDVAHFIADGVLPETSCSKKELELKFYTPVMRR
ncbi:alpha/beta hydrolase [Kordiimonas gwangyangensis]|uniref:alpha/beta hydrolase n=1 Tax=Kordiimonas gwangyangensis TaxID=288022 RepID=UPI00037CB9A4|nr:alpha/beta hydrolase [Kordiimonas gwangyangensis]